MNGQNKVSGVVLAGGMARRMQGQDKGLLICHNRPLVSYALAAMNPLVNELFVSANRHQDQYRQFNYPVISDAELSFDGPLAGILAAMQTAQHPILLVAPCDSPLVASMHLQRLLDALISQDADIAVAFDGERLHPVFAALKTRLQTDLQNYLHSGERKLQAWFHRHSLVEVDFSDSQHLFVNINTLAELSAVEQSLAEILPQ
ncbi:molybdenum cofactor guanylyltransferase [Methylomonas sp. EFPC1]|uniref:molybdenum cofactor guanylyltransferase MobA n=1 Tax=unclassified Methylomonas TaxID=2608980 RepID=UPI001492A969|nr:MULTISPECIES: molybdenum cofactor guanylyltransferase MobA [unclassified Methylomonas]NOV30592.1 molybdenum cofactor guanylyltransferase [Methylomonas sp. ZR1]QSB00340.1 molybdenum cofactor guanylyltransferase [Methylomonas sp. EFPC1]